LGKGSCTRSAQEVYSCLLEAFDDAERLIAYTDSLNVRSSRVVEKLGFTLIMSEPYESVELGMREGCKWEIMRGDVKKWNVVEVK